MQDANDISLQRVRGVKLYTNFRRLEELVLFFGGQIAVSAVLGCNFCDQLIECIYPQTRADVIQGLTVFIYSHYESP